MNLGTGELCREPALYAKGKRLIAARQSFAAARPKIFKTRSTHGRKTVFAGQMSADLSTMAEIN